VLSPYPLNPKYTIKEVKDAAQLGMHKHKLLLNKDLQEAGLEFIPLI